MNEVFEQVIKALREMGEDFALVGGLAVSLRSEPRFTSDIDLAIAVENDESSEQIVSKLLHSGYKTLAIVEQRKTSRLSTARLLPLGENEEGIVVDLIFSSCGIEQEVVREAEMLEVLPGVFLKVARSIHLVAMKVLSHQPGQREQDRLDCMSLMKVMDKSELIKTEEALKLITKRGYNRGKNLLAEFENFKHQLSLT